MARSCASDGSSAPRVKSAEMRFVSLRDGELVGGGAVAAGCGDEVVEYTDGEGAGSGPASRSEGVGSVEAGVAWWFGLGTDWPNGGAAKGTRVGVEAAWPNPLGAEGRGEGDRDCAAE